ncbi:hypothetical protein [Azospirillum thermophilum]|uniref:hypothetical protein n=1 Tax=Azospirillum thermophilum TaxID=2202148 RepID=UPI00143D138B|nr:hypothetical protein [Azospirillum thermophilum]
MNTRHSVARALIAGGFALVSLLAVAASAAVTATTPAAAVTMGEVLSPELFQFN